jgi:hypothetical protein
VCWKIGRIAERGWIRSKQRLEQVEGRITALVKQECATSGVRRGQSMDSEAQLESVDSLYSTQQHGPAEMARP